MCQGTILMLKPQDEYKNVIFSSNIYNPVTSVPSILLIQRAFIYDDNVMSTSVLFQKFDPVSL